MKTDNWVNGMSVYFYGNDIEKWNKICKDAEEGKVPSVTIRGVEFELVRHGKWIYKDEAVFGNPYGHYNCSVCGNGTPHRTQYCCYCGAKMNEVNDEL